MREDLGKTAEIQEPVDVNGAKWDHEILELCHKTFMWQWGIEELPKPGPAQN